MLRISPRRDWSEVLLRVKVGICIQQANRSRFLLQPTDIRPQESIKHVPEPPVGVRLVVIEATVLLQLRSVADNVAREPTEDGNRAQHPLRHRRLRRQGLGDGSQLGPPHGGNVRHELGLGFLLRWLDGDVLRDVALVDRRGGLVNLSVDPGSGGRAGGGC